MGIRSLTLILLEFDPSDEAPSLRMPELSDLLLHLAELACSRSDEIVFDVFAAAM
jgi:hypothetical protein